VIKINVNKIIISNITEFILLLNFAKSIKRGSPFLEIFFHHYFLVQAVSSNLTVDEVGVPPGNIEASSFLTIPKK
jgi:hypothetical protein